MAPQWIHGVMFKVLGIAALALLLMIPLGQVNDLIGERQQRAAEATQHIAERWGASQTIGGPVLVVPVRYRQQQEKGVVVLEENEFLLPDTLDLQATMAPEIRRYGMYETAVYTADVKVSGRFAGADVAALTSAGREPQWQRAQMRVPIADVRGIRRVSTLHAGTAELTFGPDGSGLGGFAAIAAPIAIDAASVDQPLPFAFDVTLAGTERLAALPLSRRTALRVEGAWADPGFDGAFLPLAHRVTESGFEANWQVLDLSRRIAQHWRASEANELSLGESTFGVSLVRPASAYQQNVRAGKYGVLFIALTFAAFFLFEVLRGLRVHPVQYLLVGLALCTFYVVLLALSEQIGFGPAYALAAAATVVMVGGYAAAVLANRRAGLMLGGVLALIDGLLYGLVRSEDYALLMGALALLFAVAAMMALTRRVDWYSMGTPARAR
ncbi:MAG: cell envelope integrity protein CreD [Dokdonella sp.]|uniref:cell envelope integrity protein CreD n=1 Tax=Dokdonella sp. TaxID=2291710 RepID=UPI003267B394